MTSRDLILDNTSSSRSSTLSSYFADDDYSTQAENNIQIVTLNSGNAHRSVSLRDPNSCDPIQLPPDCPPPPTQPESTNVWNDDTVGSSTPLRSQYRVTFEIIKAKIIFESSSNQRTSFTERKRFVSYTILVKRVPGLDPNPGIIDRRYSQFFDFYTSIKRRYSQYVNNVSFPRKIFIGNFNPEIISDRSAAFKKFLTYCLSIAEIRASKEFSSFLFFPELHEAKKLLMATNLEEAAIILENVYYIQEKLMTLNSKPNAQLIHTMCCIVACFNAVDCTNEAKMFANKVFELLFDNGVLIKPAHPGASNVLQVNNLYESCELVFPLILLSIRRRWFSGQKKVILENKLEELCRKQSLSRNYDSHPTLLEIILKKQFSLIVNWLMLWPFIAVVIMLLRVRRVDPILAMYYE